MNYSAFSATDWILFVLVLILILYVISSLFQDREIVTTSVYKAGQNIEASQVYHLPTAAVDLVATASVLVIKKKDDNAVLGLKLLNIELASTTRIVPDTSSVCAIKYSPSAFSSDTLTFNISTNGLLDGINLTLEDKLSSIIEQVTNAPSIILAPAKTADVGATLPAEHTSEIKKITQNFFVSPADIAAGSRHLVWEILVEGAEPGMAINGSFKLAFNDEPLGSSPAMDCEDKKSKTRVKGVFTRCSRTMIMSITPDDTDIKGITDYTIIIPETRTLISVPMSRTPFVKKSYSGKLNGGMFTESGITKPSEVDGFIGIPIQIAKALVSIPAQLISFKIENIKRQTTLVTTEDALKKAEQERQKQLISWEVEKQKLGINAANDIAKLQMELEKNTIEARKDLLIAQKSFLEAKKQLSDYIETLNG